MPWSRPKILLTIYPSRAAALKGAKAEWKHYTMHGAQGKMSDYIRIVKGTGKPTPFSKPRSGWLLEFKSK